MSINDEFSALKSRVVNKAKNFKANQFKYKALAGGGFVQKKVLSPSVQKKEIKILNQSAMGGFKKRQNDDSLLPDIQRATSPLKLLGN